MKKLKFYNFCHKFYDKITATSKNKHDVIKALVTLLGITIDDKPIFDANISNLAKFLDKTKSSKLLKGTPKKQTHPLINSFVYSNIYYCLLLWYFTSSKYANNLEKIKPELCKNTS